MELLAQIAKPRPVGTAMNKAVTEKIGAYLKESGYEVRRLPFACKVWETKPSFLQMWGAGLPVASKGVSQTAGK